MTLSIKSAASMITGHVIFWKEKTTTTNFKTTVTKLAVNTGNASNFLSDGTTKVAVVPTTATTYIQVAIPQAGTPAADWTIAGGKTVTLTMNVVENTALNTADLSTDMTLFCAVDTSNDNNRAEAAKAVKNTSGAKLATLKQNVSAPSSNFVTTLSPTF